MHLHRAPTCKGCLSLQYLAEASPQGWGKVAVSCKVKPSVVCETHTGLEVFKGYKPATLYVYILCALFILKLREI